MFLNSVHLIPNQTWDEKLQKRAQQHADKCITEHNPANKVLAFNIKIPIFRRINIYLQKDQVGENIYWDCKDTEHQEAEVFEKIAQNAVKTWYDNSILNIPYSHILNFMNMQV